MGKLPFVVQPKAKPVKIKIGNEDIGVFEIERRGYLNVAEKSFVDGFTQSSETLKSIVGLATKISVGRKMSREAAYQCVVKILSGENLNKLESELAMEYQEQISDLTAAMTETQNRKGIAVATIMLQSRVNPEWTLDDTLELDPIIVSELLELYDQEEAKQRPEDFEQKKEDPAEVLGK